MSILRGVENMKTIIFPLHVYSLESKGQRSEKKAYEGRSSVKYLRNNKCIGPFCRLFSY